MAIQPVVDEQADFEVQMLYTVYYFRHSLIIKKCKDEPSQPALIKTILQCTRKLGLLCKDSAFFFAFEIRYNCFNS